MGTFANSEDPDEMPQNAAFHQGLHCSVLKTKSIFKERKPIIFSIIRPPDECVLDNYFLYFSPKHLLWVLKRTVSLRRFF